VGSKEYRSVRRSRPVGRCRARLCKSPWTPHGAARHGSLAGIGAPTFPSSLARRPEPPVSAPPQRRVDTGLNSATWLPVVWVSMVTTVAGSVNFIWPSNQYRDHSLRICTARCRRAPCLRADCAWRAPLVGRAESPVGLIGDRPGDWWNLGEVPDGVLGPRRCGVRRPRIVRSTPERPVLARC
jgi:hypothetical protein